MPVHLLVLAAGFVLLAKGAGWLVDGGSSLAKRWGVSPWIIGLTVVAWGTSLPEVVVSGLASQRGQPGAALGNVLGSNVANIGLVLGTAGLILPSLLYGRVTLRESISLLLSLGLLWLTCANGTVSRLEGGLLLTVFLLFTVEVFRRPRAYGDPAEVEEHLVRYPWLATIVGSVGIGIGAELVLRGASGVAEIIGLDDGLVGLVILAVGTSLPELAASIQSALRGRAEISFGNVIGSNVFNCLAVIGVASLVAPFDASSAGWAEASENALARDFPINLAFALIVLLSTLLLRRRLGRTKALLLLGLYLGYTGYLGVDALMTET